MSDGDVRTAVGTMPPRLAAVWKVRDGSPLIYGRDETDDVYLWASRAEAQRRAGESGQRIVWEIAQERAIIVAYHVRDVTP